MSQSYSMSMQLVGARLSITNEMSQSTSDTTPTPEQQPPTPYDLALYHQQSSHSLSPIYTFLLSSPTFSHTILPSPHTTRGTSLSSIILSDVHLNSKGSIHGSVSATFVDWASGNALSTMGRGSGVSLDMHTTFLSTCKGGEKVLIKVGEI